jgi:hypothetical protein
LFAWVEGAWFVGPLSALQQTLPKLAHSRVFAFTFPFDSRGFFITQDHVESCRCFMLWDQQIPLFSVFWATHHFLMCPKCNVSYVSKMQRHMVNNIFVSHVSMCFNQEIYMPCSSGTATIFPVTQHSLGIQEIWIVKVLNDFFLCSWPSGLSKS